MLGEALLYVGITLFSNGVSRLQKVDAKSAAIMNLFNGGLSLFLNFITACYALFAGGGEASYYASATGLLFGFTYLYIGINGIFNLDNRPYGWYSLFVAVNSIPAGILAWNGGAGWKMAVIWWLWGVLWFTGWVEGVAKKNLGSFVGWLAVFEGIFTAWIPGFLMLTNHWDKFWR